MSISNEEVWRPIEGHPYYEVSSLGRVRSLDRKVNHFSGGLKRTAISNNLNKRSSMAGGFVWSYERITYVN